MKNNLYYTPTISEFYVGFEYEEYQFLTRDWKTVKCEFIKPNTTIDPKWFRVKTLNQSDIESLGWEFKKLNNNGNLYQKGIYFLYQKDNGINIEDRIGKSLIESTHYFYGTIKNKSELIKLMQQLNIK